MVFAFKWLRRLVRSNTNPIAADKAELWRLRLSAIYLFLGFNTIGAILIAAYKGKLDWAAYYGIKSDEELSISPSRQWAMSLGKSNAQHYRLSGFTLTKLEDVAPPVASESESLDEPILENNKSDI